mmetsp:Transcript_2773/g.4876  ORF Transcript_2773/g.4876 Transcript_2773/m.4876 type:complete len:142 (-) Transcript_2773:2408-2833(-)
MMSDFKKIGIGLTSFGLFFTFLGVLLLFDKSLLAMGNVLFLSGVTLIIGAQRSVRFFLARRRWKGSACFFSGITLVLIGWPIIGTLVEAFGFVNLFGYVFSPFLCRISSFFTNNVLALHQLKVQHFSDSKCTHDFVLLAVV